MNMSSLISSICVLDLGFIKTATMFVITSISGLSFVLLEHVFSKSQHPLNNLQKKANDLLMDMNLLDNPSNSIFNIRFTNKSVFSKFFTKTNLVCGSSAACYGFIGAELSTFISRLNTIKSKRYSHKDKQDAEFEFAQLATMVVFRLMQFGLEIFSMTQQSEVNYGMVSIAHSAHIGGFLSGILLMRFWNWVEA
ncbi:hypothetical protein BC833DRAFT_585214 [Globomyces pollinis-pini]|nr:hypothetical protein BC833DRAFT_585214 [Globomyces pollinis-pini]